MGIQTRLTLSRAPTKPIAQFLVFVLSAYGTTYTVQSIRLCVLSLSRKQSEWSEKSVIIKVQRKLS
jgi:hypothetical protein